MKTNFWNKTLSAVTIGFLFLCVSCSHTKTTVSSLEGLSSEASPVEENTEDKVANSAPTQEVANTVVVAPLEEAAPVEEAASVEEVAGVEQAPNTEEVAATEEVAPKEEAAFTVPEALTESPVVATNDEPSAVSPNSEEAPSQPAVSTDSAADKKDRDINSKKRRKHRRHRRHRGKTADNLDIQELLNAYSNKVDKTEKGKPDLASADLTSFVEKNLFPLALFMVGALIATFFAVRRNRKTDTPL
jgi:hypothetical protein